MICFIADGLNCQLEADVFATQLPALRYHGKRVWTFEGRLIERKKLGKMLAGVVKFNTGKKLASPSWLVETLEQIGTFVHSTDWCVFEAFIHGFVIREPGASVTGDELHRVWKDVFGHRQPYSASDLLWAMRDDFGYRLNAQWGRTVLDARLRRPMEFDASTDKPF